MMILTLGSGWSHVTMSETGMFCFPIKLPNTSIEMLWPFKPVTYYGNENEILLFEKICSPSKVINKP